MEKRPATGRGPLFAGPLLARLLFRNSRNVIAERMTMCNMLLDTPKVKLDLCEG